MRPRGRKLKPFPESARIVPYSAVFSEEEFKAICAGYRPRVMEDRWLAFVEDDFLYFHRSWTGICIYRVAFERRRDRHAVIEALANGDANQYGETDGSFDARMLHYLIRRLLLGRWAWFPRARRIPGP